MKIKRLLKALIRRLIWGIFWFLPIEKNKVFVSSYYGNGYGDNPKYIVEELLKYPNLKIVWVVKNSSVIDSLPEGVIPCVKDSLAYIYHITTSRIWIDNCRKSFYYKKRNQFYIQTWHGFALKRIEKDVVDHLGKGYQEMAINDSRATDLIVSCSKFMTQIYRNSFWYTGKIIETGAARNDVILNKNLEIRSKVYNFFDLPENKKIVLYAPTFRNNHSLEPYSLDYKGAINACKKRFDGDFVCLVRLHPNISALSDGINYNKEILNATDYPDMQELLSVVDIVISDYSSLMFDFALSQRPCFQFATDIEEYRNDRNFYFTLDKLPFPLSTNNHDMQEEIENFDDVLYKNKLKDFYNDVGMIYEGNASEKIANIVMDNI